MMQVPVSLAEMDGTLHTGSKAILSGILTKEVICPEEFLTVLPLLGRKTSEDIFNALMLVFIDISVNIKKLVLVAIDGAPSMVGR